MKYRRCTLAIGLACCLARRAAAWNHVSEAKLQEALESSGYTLVAFVLPTQNASKAIEKEWAVLQETEKDDNIVSFDCAASPKVCRDLGVRLFPAVRMYHRDGRMDRHRGERTAREFTMFLRRSLRPPVLEMEVQVGPKLMEIDNVVVAGYIHPQDWVTYDRFYELAKKYRGDYGFVMSPPDEGATGSLVICHNNIEGEKHELVEMDAVDDLDNFVKRCAQPTIPVLSRRKWEEAFQTGKRILHLFPKDNTERERFRKDFRSLAKEHADTLQVVLGDATDSEIHNPSPAIRSHLLVAKTTPALVLEDPRTGEVYPYHRKGEDRITNDQVLKFLAQADEQKIGLWGSGKQHPEKKQEQGQDGQKVLHEEL